MGDIILKILGGIDLMAGIAFLMLVFGAQPWTTFWLFCAGLLFFKSLFVLGGDVLSWIDLFSAVLLILSLWIALPSFLIWLPALLLLSKAMVSFI